MSHITDYKQFVDSSEIDELFLLANGLENKKILNINSTSMGGGVAEILLRMVPLLKQLGLDAKWSVIKGDDKFFGITKKFHNALHGVTTEILNDEFEYFTEINKKNLELVELDNDINFIHDPQPVALIEDKNRYRAKWLWRCHIDFTEPDQKVFGFLKRYVAEYDGAVFSAPSFARGMNPHEFLISPSIDPLSDKNRDLPQETVDHILSKYGIDKERPIITQISRFDYLKDPAGVIRVYKQVKREFDVQLVLAGGGATDDPEGEKVLNEVKEMASDDRDIHILLLPPASDIEINALQRGSTIILQKSLKEGFGLTVAEALWKEKPVIASAVGGIPLQIKHKFSGILTHNIDGTVYYIKKLLTNPEYMRFIGRNGKENVRENFLITRHIRDYLLVFVYLLNPQSFSECQ